MPLAQNPHIESAVLPAEGLTQLAVESRPPDPELAAAVSTIRERDTLDVYKRRLNGTTALTTRSVTTIGIPTTALTLLSEGIGFGPQTLAIGGTSTVVAGAIVTGSVYTGHRLTEGRRAKKAEQAQQTVRDSLSEPVDIIRNRGRGKKLTVRWYGADEHYGGCSDSKIVERFEKVVAFAEQYDVHELVVSATIADRIEERSPSERLRITTTEDLFESTKGISITDRTADESLTQLTPTEARKLLDRLKSEGAVSKTEAMAKWLTSIRPDHPVMNAYQDWERLGKPDLLRPQMAAIMRTGLERHFSNSSLAASVKVPIADSYGRTVAHRRISMEPSVTVQKTGIRALSVSSETNRTALDTSNFEQIVGMDLDLFVDQLLERDGEPVLPHEQWKLELALYHLLSRKTDSPPDVVNKVHLRSTTEHTSDMETLYSRMVSERPRGNPLRPGQAMRGTIAKEEQTIEYGRMFWNNMGKKIGASAIALTLGGAIGYGWGASWTRAEVTDIMVCDVVHGAQSTDEQSKITAENRKLCDSFEYHFNQAIGAAADKVAEGNASWENTVLIKAYELGILTPENAQDFLSLVSQQWASEKRADLANRVGLYGGARSLVGDVPQDGKNPAIWSLSPMNGARTGGYWPSHVEDHITLDNRGGPNAVLPPYTGLEMTFDTLPGDTFILPKDTPAPLFPYGHTKHVRELAIPDSPTNTNQPLIGVTGRLQTATGSGVYLGSTLDSERGIALGLPVLQGADIVAAKIVLKDFATDRVIKDIPTRVYQNPDGTFNLLIPQNTPEGYLDVKYWVDPTATTDLPVRAVTPMSAQQVGEYSRPLTDLLSPEDVSGILKSLGLPADASAAQIATAIQTSRKYSFTPYKDAGMQGSISAEPKMPTPEMLRSIAEYAGGMDSVNCNVAAMVGIIASRGQNGTSFVNGVSGFREDGDGILSKGESHAWEVTSEGVVIDGTPGGAVSTPTPDAYKDSPKTNKSTLDLATDLATALLVLSASFYAGKRITPPAVSLVRRRRQKAAEAWFQDHADELTGDFSLLRHLLYARPGTAIADTQPGASIRGIEQELQSLPPLTRKEVNQLVLERQEDGNAHISNTTVRRLRAIVDKARLVTQQS